MQHARDHTKQNSASINTSIGYMDGGKKKRIRYAITANTQTQCFGTIVILQGFNECIENYTGTFIELGKRGFYSATFDWSGQGQSSAQKRKRGRHFGFNVNSDIADLEFFLQNIIYPDCPPPYYLLTYDMGALIALSALEVVNNQFHRLLCVSPLIAPFGIKTDSLHHMVGQILTDIGLGKMRLKAAAKMQMLSDQTLDQTDNQTNIPIGSNTLLPTYHWLCDTLNTARFVKAKMQDDALRVPTLFILANQDVISNDREARKLCDYTRLADSLTIMGVGHDIIRSENRYLSQFWAAFDAFIPGSLPIKAGTMLEPTTFDMHSLR